MASINMLVSEFAHAINQTNNKAARENIRLLIIQTRNEIIRRSYENHGYVDRGLTQRFKVNLVTVDDGDVNYPSLDPSFGIRNIKRTAQPVPKPVRLTNNLPFDRVSSAGSFSNREFPFIKETTSRFRQDVPGLGGMPCYDYINGYIYIYPTKCKSFEYESIYIESAFEHPTEIQLANGEIDVNSAINDDNEFVLSEDMIGQLKEIIYKRDLLSTVRQTNEANTTTKVSI